MERTEGELDGEDRRKVRCNGLERGCQIKRFKGKLDDEN
jgi:hypothetical protein